MGRWKTRDKRSIDGVPPFMSMFILDIRCLCLRLHMYLWMEENVKRKKAKSNSHELGW